MRRPLFRLLSAAAVASTIALALAIPAAAHEVRKVGAYEFTVGWQSEPTYADEQNGVYLQLKDGNGNPVNDVSTLKVEVIYQNQKMPAQDLIATFDPDTGLGTPGVYLASIIPTRAGTYTFHFTGTINGQAIDQSFTSGPNTFDEVKEPGAVEFPAQDPSRGQLTQRVDRLDSRIVAGQTSTANDVTVARNLAIAGVVLGVIGVAGLIVGSLALARTRRTGVR